MSSIVFFVLVGLSAVFLLAIFLFVWHKQNAHSELYSEGVRNENEGRYQLALHNYEDALAEMKKLRLNRKFSSKITQKIKIMRTMISYEQAFQTTGSK